MSAYSPSELRAAAAMDESRRRDELRGKSATNAREVARLLREKAKTAKWRERDAMLAEADSWELRAKEHEQQEAP